MTDGPELVPVSRLGPTPAEGALRAAAAGVRADAEARRDLWGRDGVTRRRFLQGAGAAGAALGAQLVTTRASFGAPGEGTLVVVFLRGGVDGLSVVVPADDPHLLGARPDLAVPGRALLPLARGFGLHPALEPLHALWRQGRFTAVPAVSTPEISRSHFQAQDCLERGGSTTGAIEGWLDRVLARMGPGTTFRSVAQGSTLSRSLAGLQPTLTLNTVESFALAGWEDAHEQTRAALTALYTGIEHPLAPAVATTFEALDTGRELQATAYTAGATYPEGEFAEGLAELARLIKGDVGLRVGCIDYGGWDHHADQGTLDGGVLRDMLTVLGQSLAAFATDLGPRIDDVTVVAMTEFGRRVEQNASWGTDHGHGATVLLLGGGLVGNTIHGNWPGLAPEALDQGDVAGANDYRNVLGELVTSRLGVTDLSTIFPDHRFQPLGFMR